MTITPRHALDAAGPRRFAGLVLGTWLVAAIAAGWADVFVHADRPPFELLAFVALPLLIIGGAFATSPSFRAFAEGLPLQWLLGSHAWRLVGAGFLVGWYRGALPAGFAIPEGLGDTIAALWALVLLRQWLHAPVARGWLVAWNVFGLVDLLAALTLGVLYSAGPLALLASTGSATTRPMVTFPVSLIPTFFVPLFILLHLLTFTRLGAAAQARMPARTRRT
jgi:hypothetical protein